MSLTFESPTRGVAGSSEAYFTPLNMPTIHNTTATEESNTPYYTAPINPGLHQDFLNAIQARHSTQPTVLTIPQPPSFPLNLSLPPNRRMSTNSTTSATSATSTCNLMPPIDSTALAHLITSFKDTPHLLLLLDVRSFVQFSHSKIKSAINISIPNTILKRPSFTLDKVYEAIVLDAARDRLKTWASVDAIVFYDQQSLLLQENSASAYLAAKLIRAGFKGQLNYLKGGFDAFTATHKDKCESTLSSSSFQQQQRLMMASALGPPTDGGFNLSTATLKGGRPKLRLNNLPMATPTLGPFTAPMPQFENQAFNPFFSNIRQNMELSHGPIRERFPVRLPSKCNVDLNKCVQTDSVPRCVAGGHMDHPEQGLFKAPNWLHATVQEDGAQILAETYEKLERTEQRRLQNIMHFHSKHTDNPSEFPFSIVAGIEMGALNRYTNIWPFEYTRVKLRQQHGVSDYINASYVQYIESKDSVSDARPDQVNTETVQIMKQCATQNNTLPYRRYISTQGPLPATFNDFWQVVWEQNSRVLVMLTKEEEMNKIKCHRYWPELQTPTQYGHITITMTSETIQPVQKVQEEDQPLNVDDVVIVRALKLEINGEMRQVTHLQYTGWMDFGVPDNPLGTLQIIQMADEAQAVYPTAGPMVVHCSAGCGRSGAFCAIDTVLHRISMNKDLNNNDDILLQTISRFREQRLSMVQTLRQFVFCYEAIWWWFLGYGLEKSVEMDTSK